MTLLLDQLADGARATVHAVQQYWTDHPPGSEDTLPPAPQRVRRWRGARSLH